MTLHLNAVATGLTTGLTQARASVSGFAGSMRAIQAVAASAAVGGMVSFIRSTVDAADKTIDLSQQLGVTAAALTRLQYAAIVGGSSAEAMNTALGKLNKTLGDAVAVGGPAAAMLNALGLSAAELAAMAPDQAFAEIAEQISRIESPSARARAAMTLFGRSGQDVINVLAQGKRGLRAFADESDRTHFTLTNGAVKALDEMDAAMKKLTLSWEGFKRTAVVKTGPITSDALDRTSEFVARLSDASSSLEVFMLLFPGINMEVARASKSADTLAGNINKAGQAVRGLSAGAAQLQVPTFLKERGDIIADLNRQAEEFGKNAEELALYRLALMGARGEELAFAKGIVDRINAMREAAAETEKAAEATQRLADLESRVTGRGVDDTLLEGLTGRARKNAEGLLQMLKQLETQSEKAEQSATTVSGGMDLEGFGRQVAPAIERRFNVSIPGDKKDLRFAEQQLREQKDSRKANQQTATNTQRIYQKLSTTQNLGLYSIPN